MAMGNIEMRPFAIGFVLFCTILGIKPVTVSAEGALAIGGESNVLKFGFASGIALGQADAEKARAVALEQCRTQATGGAPAKERCHVVSTFSDQCVAVTEDPKAGTPGIGWGIGTSQKRAEDAAIAKCRASAGESRRQFCVVTMSGCDGRAK